MFITYFAFFLIAHGIPLEQQMSPAEQKKTGICKLNKKEKIALQKWMDQMSTQKTATKPSVKQKNLFLHDNLLNGSLIRLSDNSLWEIDPKDTLITQGWITPVDIFIHSSQDPIYPFILKNSLTGSSVKAKKTVETP